MTIQEIEHAKNLQAMLSAIEGKSDIIREYFYSRGTNKPNCTVTISGENNDGVQSALSFPLTDDLAMLIAANLANKEIMLKAEIDSL